MLRKITLAAAAMAAALTAGRAGATSSNFNLYYLTANGRAEYTVEGLTRDFAENTPEEVEAAVATLRDGVLATAAVIRTQSVSEMDNYLGRANNRLLDVARHPDLAERPNADPATVSGGISGYRAANAAIDAANARNARKRAAIAAAAEAFRNASSDRTSCWYVVCDSGGFYD